MEALEEEMREKRKYETSQSYLKEAQAVVSTPADLSRNLDPPLIIDLCETDG